MANEWQPTDEELTAAIGRARDTQFADLILLAISLAAETHPELLQKALAKVFDLGAIRETYKRAVEATKEMVGRMQKLREEEMILRDRITKLENRLDLYEDRRAV
jgi:hypothetical protein